MSTIADASGRSLARNAASQVAGRVALSLGRLVAAIIIVRLAGAGSFGGYVLVLQFVFLAEWLADFGQTDLAVRDIARDPAAEGAILSSLMRLKLLHASLLVPGLPLLLLAMAYPAPIVEAGVAGAVSVLAYAALQPLRAWFRVRMQAERDVAAEIGGLVVMLPLTFLAAATDRPLAVLVGCYGAARVVQFGLALAFVGAWPPVKGGYPAKRLLGAAAPLGVAGLLVALYDSLATLILSKLADLDAVAQYAAATRFVFPIIIAIQALVSAFAAPLAAAWRHDAAQLRRLQQVALDVSLLAGGLLFSIAFAAAPFLLGLLGPGMREASTVLHILCLVVLVRAVSTAMSPLLLVAGRQLRALWLTATAVAVQSVVLAVLTPRYGLVGAACGYLAVEVVVSVVPICFLAQRAAGVRMSWAVPLRLIACAMAAVALAGWAPFAGSAAAGVLAGLLYVGLVLATRTVEVAQLRRFCAVIIARGAVSATEETR